MSNSESAWVDRATQILDEGGVVAIPTETVYGLAARIDRESGLKSIFQLKKRPFFDPLIVHVAHIDQLRDVVESFPPIARDLAHAFWPGPLTLVLKSHSQLNPMINSGLATVGVRQPQHPLTLKLLEKTGPLAAPSANLFGRTSPTQAVHVQKEFGSQLMVLDGGPCQVGIESTVLLISPEEKKLIILRPGILTEETLQDFLDSSKSNFMDWVLEKKAGDSQSPGQLKHHYQPAQPLVILEMDEGQAKKNGSPVASAATPDLPLSHLCKAFSVSPEALRELRLNSSPELAARELYAEMRRLSEEPGCRLIYVKKRPSQTQGLWASLWDRLERASSAVVKSADGNPT